MISGDASRDGVSLASRDALLDARCLLGFRSRIGLGLRSSLGFSSSLRLGGFLV